MTTLSKAQQTVVDYLKSGARLIVSLHMDGHWLFEVENKDGELLHKMTANTFDALVNKGVIEPMSRKGHWKLTKEYR